MPKYEVIFKAVVTIDAKNASEAIKEAWLIENLNNAVYTYLDCQREVKE